MLTQKAAKWSFSWIFVCLLNNFPSEESSGEEFSASCDFFKRRILLAKNTPSEESFGRRIIRAKKYPAKNHPSEELSGEEFSQRRNILAKNHPNFPPPGIFFRAKNFPAKNYPGE
jgi:hypothetical protein